MITKKIDLDIRFPVYDKKGEQIWDKIGSEVRDGVGVPVYMLVQAQLNWQVEEELEE